MAKADPATRRCLKIAVSRSSKWTGCAFEDWEDAVDSAPAVVCWRSWASNMNCPPGLLRAHRAPARSHCRHAERGRSGHHRCRGIAEESAGPGRLRAQPNERRRFGRCDDAEEVTDRQD